ncbi:hypothetical protein I862_07350 [endosymbiont of Acanthamoeba sp. UWC8]|uniref:nucleic acid/nucleotide deaminase domain-containing protein n=1 Tax=endosymbiont of Acanthamoeba sp. UWC8 TaxID=86106 RepID=UPI0004D11015|nr:nucleic acid/nucleotide deaminase domain-containing protein [endosymbiont of Acanthamoeba sp. UWC8]AIF82024.1 hypothetical protein I862_07350 [endosymbiont of Acanthamoeba sp. UWC8]
MHGSKRDINDIPPKSRRLDSIGALIEGANPCGAAYFDGRTLLLATNNNIESELIRDIKRLLTYISVSSELQYSDREKPDYYEWKNEVVQNIDDIKEKYRRSFESKGRYYRQFSDALEKVTNSIILAYSNPSDERAFTTGFVRALVERRYAFIEGKQNVHAELKIIQHLMEEKRIGRREAAEESIYIGVSKRCCLKCEKMIEAINEAAEEMGFSAIEELISIRGIHRQIFPATIPDFIDYNNNILEEGFRRNIRRKFLAKMEVDSLSKAFAMKGERRVDGRIQVHERSPHLRIGLKR